jgi:hypothetical protein
MVATFTNMLLFCDGLLADVEFVCCADAAVCCCAEVTGAFEAVGAFEPTVAGAVFAAGVSLLLQLVSMGKNASAHVAQTKTIV